LSASALANLDEASFAFSVALRESEGIGKAGLFFISQ
jgi:hypothetical protein